MGKPGILTGIGDELKQLGSTAAHQISGTAKDGVKAPVINGIEQGEQKASLENKTEKPAAQPHPSQENDDFVKALYGVSEQPAPEQQAQQQDANNKAVKQQELQQKHSSDYYQPLIQKIKEHGQKAEDTERTADRVERLEMEDLQEKNKKEEEKKPISVQRAETSIESDKSMHG